jgi:hypothetical protein
MWVKYRKILINLDNLCAIIKRRTNNRSSIERGEEFRVELCSSGKCFHIYEFRSEKARDMCYDELTDKVLEHNFNKTVLGDIE